jgi:hypothetical protein
MARTVTIYVPCDVVPIRVRFRQGDSVSPIELTLLEALASGSRGTGELADLLCLSERMILDVISDLWRLGYVVLDFARGEVRLSDATAARAAQGTLDKLPGAESGGSVMKIMYERLSGQVLPFGGRRYPANSRLAVPVEGTGKTIEDASPAQLLRAVQATVDNGATSDGMMRRRVVAAHLSPASLRGAVERMWLPLEVRVGSDDTAGRLKVTVLGNLLHESQRAEAARSLVRFAEEFPKHRFAQALRSEVDLEYEDPPSLHDLVDRMRHQADAAASSRAGTRSQHHRALRQTAFSAAGQLASIAAQEVTAAPVFGRSAERAALRAIIREAHAQIVLVSPLIRTGGIEEFFELLAAALDRGVQVVVVWGRSPEEPLDPSVQRALSQLARSHGGHAGEGEPDVTAIKVLWSARPARVSVTIAIADDRLALITGDALLASAGTADVAQLGVQLASPRPRERCRPIEQLLEWAGRAIPEHRLANAMFVRHEHFSRHDTMQLAVEDTESGGQGQSGSSGYRPESSADAATDRIWSDALADLPGDPPESDDDHARLEAWSRAWAEFVARFRTLVAARTMPRAQLVEDDEHRELMWHALRTSGSRLVIGSPELSHAVLTDQMLTALRERLADGVDVTVLFGSTAPHKREESEKALTELVERHKFTLRQLPSNARFLIRDGEIAIGSYRYLSTAARGSAGGSTRRSELSVLLTAPSIADDVSTILCGSGPPTIPALAPVRTSADPAEHAVPFHEVPSTSAGTSVLTAQRLLDRTAAAETEPERAKIVREVLGGEEDPWAVVSYLLDVGAAPAVMRLATAASWNRPGGKAHTGQEWLIMDLWRSRQFVEAAILRESLPSPELRPSSALARIAVTRGSADTAEALMAAAFGELTSPEQTLLGLVTTAELLIGCRPGQQGWDGPEISEILGILLDRLDEPWRALARATHDYWSKAGEPMPLRSFRAAGRRARDAEQVTHDWAELQDALAKAAQTTLAPVQGKKAHALLFDPGGVFGALRNAVESRDVTAVEAWTHRPEIADLGGLVDATTAEISAQVTALAGPARRGYLGRLSAVVKAAQQLAAGAGHITGQETLVSAEAEAMARKLAEQWDGLVAAADQMADPERFLTQAVLDDLSVIHEWATA